MNRRILLDIERSTQEIIDLLFPKRIEVKEASQVISLTHDIQRRIKEALKFVTDVEVKEYSIINKTTLDDLDAMLDAIIGELTVPYFSDERKREAHQLARSAKGSIDRERKMLSAPCPQCRVTDAEEGPPPWMTEKINQPEETMALNNKIIILSREKDGLISDKEKLAAVSRLIDMEGDHTKTITAIKDVIEAK